MNRQRLIRGSVAVIGSDRGGFRHKTVVQVSLTVGRILAQTGINRLTISLRVRWVYCCSAKKRPMLSLRHGALVASSLHS